MHVSAAHFGARRLEQRRPGGQLRACELANLDRPLRRGHHRGKDGLRHLRYIVDSMIRQRAPWILILLMLVPLAATAQTYSAPQARRQWITVSYDWQYTYP